MSRTKGHSFERKVAQWFVEAGFPEARRQLEYHVKDALGVDLQGTEPFAVQCKRKRTYAPITAIEEVNTPKLCVRKNDGFARQTSEDSCMTCGCLPHEHPAAVPVLITQADHKPAMAVLPADEFLKLVRLAYPA